MEMETNGSLIQRRVEASTTCLDLARRPRGSGEPEFAVRLTCRLTRYISAGRGRKLELRYRGDGANASFVVAGGGASVPAYEDGVRGVLKAIQPLQELGLTDDEWESILPEDVVPQLADLARGRHADAGGAAEVDMAVDRHVRYSPARVLMTACRKVGEAAGDDDDEAECSVCFDALGGEEAVKLPGCAHAFHRRCISRWFRKKPTCPMCRGDVMKHLHPELQKHIADFSDAS